MIGKNGVSPAAKKSLAARFSGFLQTEEGKLEAEDFAEEKKMVD